MTSKRICSLWAALRPSVHQLHTSCQKGQRKPVWSLYEVQFSLASGETIHTRSLGKKHVHESAECIKISLRALISKAKSATLLTVKWAKWHELGHRWSQEYLWHPPAVKVFQSLRFPMLDLSINTPSTAAPGLSIIFCQRCCSSPWESIQSTSLPLLTPDNCKNTRHFAVLRSSWVTPLLVYYNSVQEKWRALYTSPVQGVTLKTGSSCRAPVCHWTPSGTWAEAHKPPHAAPQATFSQHRRNGFTPLSGHTIISRKAAAGQK